MLGIGRTYDLVPAFEPLDLQTARNGDYVSLKNCQSVDIIIFKGAGTAGDDPVLTVQQASDVAGTGVKSLSVITQYFMKQATTDLTGTGTWTKVTQAAAATISFNDTSAESVALYVVHIEADQLDADNGFDCIRANIADTGTNAQLGCILYHLNGPRYQTTPANLPNSIID